MVYNPSSPTHFKRFKVCPQVIQRILNTTRCFQLLHSFSRVECTSFQSLQKFASPSLWCHSCIRHKETNPSLILSETSSVKMMESLRPVRHHTAVDRYPQCERASFTVANPGSTRQNGRRSCATSVSTVCLLEVLTNSRNSSDLQRQSFHVPLFIDSHFT